MCSLLEVSPTGLFPDVCSMNSKSTRVCKKLRLATFDVESLSWWLVLQPEPSHRRVYATLNLLESSSGRTVKTGHRLADQTGVESAYGVFSLQCSFAAAFPRVCVCVCVCVYLAFEIKPTG